MTFKEFKNLFDGTLVDFDAYYSAQCVDLVQFWSRAIGGQRFWGNAKDIINQPGAIYTVVKNNPTNVPQEGDIVVLSGNYNGGYGHVGIATGKGDINSFEMFEQNDPTYSKCQNKTYNYKFVTGWLHKK